MLSTRDYLFIYAVLGIKPRVLCMRGKFSTTELYPYPKKLTLFRSKDTKQLKVKEWKSYFLQIVTEDSRGRSTNMRQNG